MSATVIVRCTGCGCVYRPTLELVQARARARCARCGTTFQMVPEQETGEVPLPPASAAPEFDQDQRTRSGRPTQRPPLDRAGAPTGPPPSRYPEHVRAATPVPTAPPAAVVAFPDGPPWPWAELCKPEAATAPATPRSAPVVALIELLTGAPEQPVAEGSS